MSLSDFEKKNSMNNIQSLVNTIQNVKQNSINKQNVLNNIQKDKEEKQVSTSTSFDSLVESISSGDDIVNARNVSNAIDSSLAGNPEAIIQKIESDGKLNNQAMSYLNFKGVIDSAYDKYHTIKNLENKDINKWTTMYISNELDYIDDFMSTMYENPLEQENPVKFLGRYSSKGTKLKGPVKENLPLRDISIVNEIKDYKKILEAALVGMRTNGYINDTEMFHVLAGDKQGILDDIESVKKNSSKRIDSLLRSQNTIKKYQKDIDKLIISKDLKGSDKMGIVNIPMDILLSEYDLDMSNPLYQNKDGSPLDLETYSEDKLASYEDMTVQEVLDMWANESIGIQSELEKELFKYFHATGEHYIEKGKSKIAKQEEDFKLARFLKEQKQ